MNRKPTVLTALAMSGLLFASSGLSLADKLDPAADAALKAMSEKLAGAKSLTLKAKRSVSDESAEAAIVSEISVVRPDKVAAVSKGEGVERHFFYDGKSITVFNPGRKIYASAPVSGDIDAMLDQLEEKLGFTPPIGDLLVADPYDSLLGGEQTGKVVGEEEVAGAKCQHLKFSQEMVDWEVWIGEDSLPRRFVITFKDEGDGELVMTMDGLEWDFGAEIDAGSFTFTAPADAEKVEIISPEEAAKKAGN